MKSHSFNLAESSGAPADAANVDNLKHLSQIVAQIARIDRLPDGNSNEAMYTLKDAWDHVDIYTHLAHRSKFIAQAAYFLLLAVSKLCLRKCNSFQSDGML